MCLALPGKIVSITGKASHNRVAKVDFGGISKEVNLAFVPEAKIGDYVNVHVGVALSIIDEEEARQVIEYLKEVAKENERQQNEIRHRI
jgi:hydrogenase expression/formation protein HypC